MNGAECLMQTARDAGIDVCFANPGTTEMPLVAAMDSAPGFRAILGLSDGDGVASCLFASFRWRF
jgi:acetolactate synthase-1/2/3 large subunit